MLKRDLLVKDRSREKLVNLATREIGVREKTGHNDGIRVEAYLASVGLKKGLPWCAAFVSWIYKEAGFIYPRSGWSPALFPPYRLARSALPGDLLAIYFPKLKRIAHVGIVEKQEGNWYLSVEGNTNSQGSSEGDGVYRKRRHVKTIYQIADWVKPERRVR